MKGKPLARKTQRGGHNKLTLDVVLSSNIASITEYKKNRYIAFLEAQPSTPEIELKLKELCSVKIERKSKAKDYYLANFSNFGLHSKTIIMRPGKK